MLVNCGCSSAKPSAPSSKSVTTSLEDSGLDLSKYKTLPIKANKTYTLKSNWDLKGETYVLPEGVTISSRGGVFKNGTLIGNNTKIDTKKPLFNKVSIMGNWNAPEITTSIFASLDYDNSLRDVLALAHPEVMNKVVIEDGEYWVSAKSFQPALEVCSNMILVIDGTIKLVPNKYQGCYVIQAKSVENVAIKGSGCIVGDKKEHKGTDGEWGHGINVIDSKEVFIQDVSVINCWGDCLYVGGNSSNITIQNCVLNEGRRQGISVTSADGVKISNCSITNVNGTAPQYGIDLEPNKGELVDNIIIEDVNIENCYGGIVCWHPDNARIGNIIIKRCKITGTRTSHPLFLQLAENIVIEDCDVSSDSEDCILVQNVGTLSATGIKMTCRGKKPFITRLVKKENVSNHMIIRK